VKKAAQEAGAGTLTIADCTIINPSVAALRTGLTGLPRFDFAH
jgi:hypothetical protein